MRVLISGAGVAGSTLAYFLAKAGARITVVEKSQEMLRQGQNVDIQGSAVTAIKKMGLLAKLKEYNTTETGTQFVDSKGHPYASFPLREGSMASMTSQYEILRGDLAWILYEAAKDHPNVNFQFNTTIKQVISKGNTSESVKVELSNGKHEEYDVLVAADGQWSKLRTTCFPQEDLKVVDKDMYTAYYTIPRLRSDNNYWNVYVGLGRRIVTTRPDPHGTIRAMFTLMPCNEAQKKEWQSAIRSDQSVQKALVKRDFANVGWQTSRILEGIEAPDFYFHAMQQIKMSKWSSGRIICLGDAAYAPTPLTGIGTTLAITGAYILAGELNRLDDKEDPSHAFRAYEGAFRPFVDKMQNIPSIIPGVAHPTRAWQRWLLKTFLMTMASIVPKILAIPWLANKMNVSNEDNDDGFPLPHYTDLDEKSFSNTPL